MREATKKSQMATIQKEIDRIDQSIADTKRMGHTGELPTWRADRHLQILEIAKKDYLRAMVIWDNIAVNDDPDTEDGGR